MRGIPLLLFSVISFFAAAKLDFDVFVAFMILFCVAALLRTSSYTSNDVLSRKDDAGNKATQPQQHACNASAGRVGPDPRPRDPHAVRFDGCR
jgi:4-hydroxybenzoate polyprenyltransferase